MTHHHHMTHDQIITQMVHMTQNRIMTRVPFDKGESRVVASDKGRQIIPKYSKI